MWDLIVSVLDHCLSFYFSYQALYDPKERGTVYQHDAAGRGLISIFAPWILM